jgi:predicted NUDIX family phosphoesterase
MADFLDAAYKVLWHEREPLSPREIVEIAVNKGWLASSGKTPWQTMKSKLSTNILEKKEQSLFMRTAKGRFTLRKWQDKDLNEYVAERYKKALLSEEILVFPTPLLPKYVPGPGLHPASLEDSKSLVHHCSPMLREDAEQDFTVIQLVSVFIVKFGKFYLTYKRTKRLPESRLHGVYSVVFGGHLNPDDVPSLFNIFDVENGATFLSRELKEELRFPKDNPPILTYRGLLYDNSRDLSRQHLGIVYDVQLESAKFEVGERGFLMDAKFESLAQIQSRIKDFENWSWIIIECERESMKS